MLFTSATSVIVFLFAAAGCAAFGAYRTAAVAAFDLITQQVNCDNAALPEFVFVYNPSDLIIGLNRYDPGIDIIIHLVAVSIDTCVFFIFQDIVDAVF